MSGLLALFGGQEHTPAASVQDQRGAELLGRAGVQVRFAFAGGPDEVAQSLGALEDPDLVVMTGGHLHARLDGSPVHDRILDLWRKGVPISGSSAGAIALCEWRQYLQPPRPLKLVPAAFGLVPGTAAARTTTATASGTGSAR